MEILIKVITIWILRYFRDTHCSCNNGDGFHRPSLQSVFDESNAVIWGHVTNHTEKEKISSYTAEVDVHCVFKGNVLNDHIKVMGAGYFPERCESFEFYIGGDYLIFLLQDDQHFQPYFQPIPLYQPDKDLKEVMELCNISSKMVKKTVNCPVPKQKCKKRNRKNNEKHKKKKDKRKRKKNKKGKRGNETTTSGLTTTLAVDTVEFRDTTHISVQDSGIKIEVPEVTTLITANEILKTNDMLANIIPTTTKVYVTSKKQRDNDVYSTQTIPTNSGLLNKLTMFISTNKQQPSGGNFDISHTTKHSNKPTSASIITYQPGSSKSFFEVKTTESPTTLRMPVTLQSEILTEKNELQIFKTLTRGTEGNTKIEIGKPEYELKEQQNMEETQFKTKNKRKKELRGNQIHEVHQESSGNIKVPHDETVMLMLCYLVIHNIYLG